MFELIISIIALIVGLSCLYKWMFKYGPDWLILISAISISFGVYGITITIIGG